IIDGDSVASCVMMNGENSKLIGFTLKNGFTNAETYGGAITVQEDSEISNCLLVENYNEESLYQSSIIIWGGDNVTFNHLTIFNNYGDGGYANGIVWLEPSSNDTLNLSHTIFYDFEQYGGDSPVENFINCYSGSEPLFCDPDNGDYTLAENSPCVGIGENSANIGAFGVGCEAINLAPVLATIEDQQIAEDSVLTIGVSATSILGYSMSFTATSDTSDVEVSLEDTNLTATPSLNWFGSSVITVIATDENELFDTTGFTLTV
ncbi:uncharacterized protein METZ01_LOCUS437399, partial [marine metagenome]